MTDVPAGAREILGRGTLCHVAAADEPGPHLTPVVFVLDGDRVWATTARAARKTRLWRRRGVAGGLVRHGEGALTFRGTVTLYDLLDPETWPQSVARAPRVTRASARFTLKNARFFAGYARDALRVPLGWTPPGRVFASIDLDAGAVLRDGTVGERWGSWGEGTRGETAFAPARGPRLDPPEEVGDLLAEPGDATLAIAGPNGPVVLPARVSRSEGAAYAVVPRPVLDLAAPGPGAAASIEVDRVSAWRASRMSGLMVRGPAQVFLPGEVERGAADVLTRARDAGPLPEDPAVVRVVPSSAVWWAGWASGTVGRS